MLHKTLLNSVDVYSDMLPPASTGWKWSLLCDVTKWVEIHEVWASSSSARRYVMTTLKDTSFYTKITMLSASFDLYDLKTPVAMDAPKNSFYFFIVSLSKLVSNQLSNR